MFQKIITKEFMTKFNGLNNRIADVYINHILYGAQKIRKCILHPFLDEECIGITINDEKKYIMLDELCSASIDDNVCCIKSEVMELRIDYSA